MKKSLKLFILFFILLLIPFFSVFAYTSEDIISEAESIRVCSGETSSLVNGMKASYTRLLSTRNVSQENLDKIFNNIKKVKDILDNYDLCAVEQENKVPSNVKDTLYDLFYETNDIILSSPKIENNNTTDSKIVVDSASKQIKIYEDGVLMDAIEMEDKLNYVGTSSTLILLIKIMISALIMTFILKLLFRKSMFLTSVIYSLLFAILICLVFRNPISKAFNVISLMMLNQNTNVKELVVSDDKIISYPSYGSKYATISINGEEASIYFGDDSNILKKGIGQKSSSSLPGENKKTILSGHNTGVFSQIFNLKSNDNIEIETIYGRFIYKIISTKIINETEVSVLDSNYDLIMYTCYPNSNLYGSKRIVAFANLIESKWVGGNSER